MPRPQSYREGQTSSTAERSRSTRGSKVTRDRVALLVVSAFLAAAAVVVFRLAHANIMTQVAFQRVKGELEALKKNFTDQRKCGPIVLKPTCWTTYTCQKCEAGWEQFGGTCYYFSNDKFSWSLSRTLCKYRGGDLVKIDSRDEQMFLDEKLKGKMKQAEDKFWIGLTDSEEEGTWLWVDDSPLNQSLTFWSGVEPDNWKNDDTIGEDCGRMGERSGAEDHKSWFDHSCEKMNKFICEKQATDGKHLCV